MAKLVLLEQLHVDLLVSSRTESRQTDRAARAIRTKRFLDDVRTAVQAAVKKRSRLRNVVIVRITR